MAIFSCRDVSLFGGLTALGKAIAPLAARRKRIIRPSVCAALAIAAVIGGNPAYAAIPVTNVQLAGPGAYYTVGINGENVYDAALLLTVGNSQLFANCDDIYHNIYLGQSASFTTAAFSTASSSSNFHGGSYSSAQVGSMSWLLDKGAAVWQAGSSQPNEQRNLAALQLASWMIGNPNAVFSNYDAGVYGLAQSYIAQSVGRSAMPGEAVEQLLSGSGVQGQLVLSHTPGAVPEPATWALMLTGFGLIGLGMRRRPSTRSQGLAAV